ncbi:hypothetical protein I4U23_031335 [Adineta vaga]|nr:hypothetical protein I4U23_031335 [Adineta vaga]
MLRSLTDIVKSIDLGTQLNNFADRLDGKADASVPFGQNLNYEQWYNCRTRYSNCKLKKYSSYCYYSISDNQYGLIIMDTLKHNLSTQGSRASTTPWTTLASRLLPAFSIQLLLHKNDEKTLNSILFPFNLCPKLMKSLFLLSIFLIFFVECTNSTRCVCKCCTSSNCDASTYAGSTTQSFDLTVLCNDVTCNRASCSTNFLGTCPIIGAAGDVDSTCDATRLTKFSMVMIIGIVMVRLIT